MTIDRKNAQGLSDAVMQQAFKIDASKLPAYAGFMDEKKAYVIVQVTEIKNTLEATEKQAAEQDFKAAVTAEYLSAYGKSLKAKSEVVVNRQLLESNTQ